MWQLTAYGKLLAYLFAYIMFYVAKQKGLLVSGMVS